VKSTHSPQDTAVSNVQVIVNNQELSISWDAPEIDDAEVVTGYQVLVDDQLVCAVEQKQPLCCVVDGFDAEKYNVSVKVATAHVPWADQSEMEALSAHPVPAGSLAAALMLALLMCMCGWWGAAYQRSWR